MNPQKQRIRELVLEVVTEKSAAPVRDLSTLRKRVVEALHPTTLQSRQEAEAKGVLFNISAPEPELSADDDAAFLEVYWDLVVERILTPGGDSLPLDMSRFRLRLDRHPKKE